jgi:hypothetical protein
MQLVMRYRSSARDHETFFCTTNVACAFCDGAGQGESMYIRSQPFSCFTRDRRVVFILPPHSNYDSGDRRSLRDVLAHSIEILAPFSTLHVFRQVYGFKRHSHQHGHVLPVLSLISYLVRLLHRYFAKNLRPPNKKSLGGSRLFRFMDC